MKVQLVGSREFEAPEGFDLLELQCDTHNLVQFQMLGKVLKRHEKDVIKQTKELGTKHYLKEYNTRIKGDYAFDIGQRILDETGSNTLIGRHD